jgi:hypothetical protein
MKGVFSIRGTPNAIPEEHLAKTCELPTGTNIFSSFSAQIGVFGMPCIILGRPSIE